jgi:hypothetical protein
MPKRVTGRHERTTVNGEEVAAFVPHALPPADPPVVVDAALVERLGAAELVAAGVLVETTGKKRDRSFVYRSYLDRLRVGTELGGSQGFGR